MKKDLGQAPLTLGGWLILVGIRLILGVLNSGNSIFKIFDLELNFAGQIIRILSVMTIVYALVVLCMFIKRHKAFPVAFIIMEAMNVLVCIISFFISTTTPPLYRDAFLFVSAIVSVIISVLWIVFILRSERVKKTFVFNWSEKPVQRLVDKANILMQ